MNQVLDEIRAGAENALYGAGSAESEELFSKHVLSLVEGAGLPSLQVMHYRWFLRALARLWRTRKGRDLAFHLELCIRKWVGLGLEPRTLQFLICEAHERLKGPKPAEPQSAQSAPSPNVETAKACTEQRERDAKSGSELTTKTPSHQGSASESTSDTGILESSAPGVLS